MNRAGLWKALAAAADDVADATTAYEADDTPATRHRMDAAARTYCELLAPVVGQEAAFRYEAVLQQCRDAADRLERLKAAYVGRALDDADTELLSRLSHDQAEALAAVGAAEESLNAALAEAEARDIGRA
jgi:hypothetical protein